MQQSQGCDAISACQLGNVLVRSACCFGPHAARSLRHGNGRNAEAGGRLEPASSLATSPSQHPVRTRHGPGSSRMAAAATGGALQDAGCISACWLVLRSGSLSVLARSACRLVQRAGSFNLLPRSACWLVERAGSFSVLAPSACWLVQRAGSVSLKPRALLSSAASMPEWLRELFVFPENVTVAHTTFKDGVLPHFQVRLPSGEKYGGKYHGSNEHSDWFRFRIPSRVLPPQTKFDWVQLRASCSASYNPNLPPRTFDKALTYAALVPPKERSMSQALYFCYCWAVQGSAKRRRLA